MSTWNGRCGHCEAPRPIKTTDEVRDGQLVLTATWKACEACGITSAPRTEPADVTTYQASGGTPAAEMGA